MKEEKQPFRSEKEAAEIIRRFEGKHRLFGYAVNGVSVWQILRFSIAMDLQNIPVKRPSMPRSTSLKHSLIGLMKIAKLIILGKKSEYWVSTFISALRLRRDNCYRDICFDSLLENVHGGLKIQGVNASGYETQQANAFIKPDIDSTLFHVIARILARLFPVNNDQGVFNSVAQLIGKELGLTSYNENFIRRIFGSFWWHARIYVLLLKLLKPNAVIVADTGEYALLLACHKQGVNIIELQHGIQTPDHPSTLSTDTLEYEAKLLLPNYWGVFGDYWKELLAGSIMAIKGRIHSVGTDMIDTYREYRIRHFAANSLCPVLTLTTQGIDTENLIHFVREFLRVSDGEFSLNIKLHPAFDNSMKPYVDALGADARCKVVSGKGDPNTYELISCSDLHLSIASACHYEALGLGVPTVVIGLTGYQLMDDLVAKGDALIAMAPEDLAHIVKHQRWGVITREMSENYFKRDFVRNVSELAQIGEYA